MTWPDFFIQKPLWGRWLILAGIAYLALCLLVFLGQRRLIYLPSRTQVTLPPGFSEWRSPAGEFWGFKRVSDKPDVLFFFHGNGGNASGWSHAAADFPGDIFVLEYPGYGKRTGTATEQSLKATALAAFEAEHRPHGRIVVCGQSLGASVTEAIFSDHPAKIDCLVLVTPFVSLSEMARDQFQWLPTRWLLRDKLELLEAWQNFPGRSVVVLARDDEIIPSAQRLRFASARDSRRVIIELPVNHNTVELTPEFWRKVLADD